MQGDRDRMKKFIKGLFTKKDNHQIIEISQFEYSIRLMSGIDQPNEKYLKIIRNRQ